MTATSNNHVSLLDQSTGARTPIETADALFATLTKFNGPAFEALLDDNIVYTNVSLPTVHGSRRVARIFNLALGRLGWGFEVETLNIAAAGSVVLTERIDALVIGRFRFQFWVMGRLEVQDGRVTVWRDYFDHYNALIATTRAILGAVAPSLRPKMGNRPCKKVAPCETAALVESEEL